MALPQANDTIRHISDFFIMFLDEAVLLLGRTLHDNRKGYGRARLNLHLRGEDDVSPVVFGDGREFFRRLRGYETQRRGVIGPVRLHAHFGELDEREFRIRVGVGRDRSQQQKVSIGRDAHVIPIDRVKRVAHRVSAGLQGLASIVFGLLRNYYDSNKRRVDDLRVHRGRHIDFSLRWNPVSEPDVAQDSVFRADAIALGFEDAFDGVRRGGIGEGIDRLDLVAVGVYGK